MDIKITTLAGADAGKVSLSDEIFGLEPREDILQRVVRWQLAKKQQGTYGPRPSPFGSRSPVPWRRQGARPGRSFTRA
jgi:ribosomal protein L4